MLLYCSPDSLLSVQARCKLSQEVTKTIEQYNNSLNGTHSQTHAGSMTNMADMSEGGFSKSEKALKPW